MVEINCSGETIKFDLDNGVYVPNDRSAIGKTYISILSQMCLSDKIPGYMCYKNGADSNLYELLLKEFMNDKYSIVLVDRYNMYSNDTLSDLIYQLGEYKPVIIDDKMHILSKVKPCLIERTEDSLIIRGKL